MTFDSQYTQYKKDFENYWVQYFQKMSDSIFDNIQSEFSRFSKLNAFSQNPQALVMDRAEGHTQSMRRLFESVRYSSFTPGKRFRPVLILATLEMLGGDFKKALAYATAVEMIHTYSLVHDDLPCMDNDDFRRGQPTNHKKFGEAPALLAGDALLTLAFEVLACEVLDPAMSQKLSLNLAKLSGFWGMISGQMTDLSSAQTEVPLETLLMVHRNKTAALLEACIVGAGILARTQRSEDLQKIGLLMGLSFQIADDLMDYAEKKEKNNLVHILGQSETQNLLEKLSSECLALLKSFGNSTFLEQLVLYNTQRKV